MFESLGITLLTAPQAVVVFGLVLGAAFGLFAERTRFCLRRAVVGQDRRQAAGVWLIALAVAILGTQGAVALGWIGFADHRFHAPDLPLAAILTGGLLFGAGMVLARGCASRLTVLAGTGNLRALIALGVFAITAKATISGVLAPIPQVLAQVTVPLGGALPPVLAPLLGLAALAFALRSGNRASTLVTAALLGALVPLAWVGTGFVFQDDFDPVAFESLAFTAPFAETLFWSSAATAVAPGFGVGLVAGVFLGAAASAALGRRSHWQSFTSPDQTGRSLAGGALMGIGGVLAGGCSVGAGLAGLPTLGIAAALALAAIVSGAWLTNALLTSRSATPAVPAE
ncbi:YeeE/YedE family protein [Mesobacterium sp. TK19101]|uniref:YeeE/YedE family protein n=1 Tax=Mesobacterium hydrothermale TaxID=3111907 RepID=A0ABU6HP43_9RHOB|nr:YeeE/YedE family protein [Mesobacterium sp. TK19101]MEC3863228.1 YeeE/YedE family protein [Mesobacterium sp. TK19101]